MVLTDFRAAISEDLKEIDLALSILNSLRNTNLARLALLQEAEERRASESGTPNKEADNGRHL